MTPKNKTRLLLFLSGMLASILILLYLKHLDESRHLPDANQNNIRWHGVDSGYSASTTRPAP